MISTSPPAIEAFFLTKRFPQPGTWRRVLFSAPPGPTAVDQVSLDVQQGELFGLLGPNGAGKTTLIKMLSTLIVPTSGSARVNGFDLSQDLAIKATLGLASSDERSFYGRLSGRQNLEFFASLHGLPAADIPARVESVLSQLDLLDVAGQRFLTYSTGMRQRLAISRALLHTPRLLILDEPTRGLDPLAAQSLRKLIRARLSEQQGLTVLMTTHDLQEASQLCDRLAIMHRGHVLASGSLPELRSMLHQGDRYHLVVSGFQANAAPSLESSLPQFTASPQAGQPTNSMLEFTLPQAEADPQSMQLDTALAALRQRGVVIHSIDRTTPSLENLFAEIVTHPPETPMGQPAHPDGLPALSAASQAAPRRWPLLHPRLMFAFLRRDARIEASYRFAFLMQFLSILFSTAVFYYVGVLLGQAVAPYLEPYGGNYFAFVLIGIAFSGYFGVGLTSFASNLREAQTTGTLEAMLTSPVRLSTVILASAQWDYLYTTLRVLIYLALGVGFMGVDLGQSNFWGALLTLLLTVVCFSGLGVLAASFIMVLKRGDPITWIFGALSSFLGGVYYPVEVLPGWLQLAARLVPVTYALHAMRLALLQGASLRLLLPDLAALLLFSIVLLPLSLWTWRFAVRRARLEGSLTHY